MSAKVGGWRVGGRVQYGFSHLWHHSVLSTRQRKKHHVTSRSYSTCYSGGTSTTTMCCSVRWVFAVCYSRVICVILVGTQQPCVAQWGEFLQCVLQAGRDWREFLFSKILVRMSPIFSRLTLGNHFLKKERNTHSRLESKCDFTTWYMYWKPYKNRQTWF